MAKQKGKTVEPKKTGRPSEYNDKYHPLLAEHMAKLGMTDKQISCKLGISEVTLNAWKKAHPLFLKSLKDGKQAPDDAVEASLFKRAIGYENTKAVKIFMPASADAPVYAPYTEQIQPDVTAAIFWLKNRRPERWREKTEVTHSGEVSLLTAEERKKRIAELERLNADRK